MNRTVFDTPVVNHIFRLLSRIGLKLTGWKVYGQAPDIQKYVMIAFPHTSNWDFPVTMAMFFRLGIKARWMGKASLFKGPMGPVMKWLGGIPVDRSKNTGLVQQLVSEFNRRKELIITIPPEGTRKKVQQWKSGFYHVAHQANVPIALGYLDFKAKKGGVTKVFYPTGNYEEDLARIQDFYRSMNIFGKRPVQAA